MMLLGIFLIVIKGFWKLWVGAQRQLAPFLNSVEAPSDVQGFAGVIHGDCF